jgi:hypothetical protein
LVGVSGFPLFCLEAFSICKVDPDELLVRAGRKLLRKFGGCKQLAQSRALLDLLFVSAANDVCELLTPMSVSGANANADEAVPMPMVRPSNPLSKIVASVDRSVGDDDSVRYERV